VLAPNKSILGLSIGLLLVLTACRSDTATLTTLPAPPFVTAAPGETIVILGTNQIRFAPSLIQATAGTFRVRFENAASIGHDITFIDGTEAKVAPGEFAEFDVVVPEGGISFICTVPGHFEAGMKGRIFTGDAIPLPADITRDGFPPPAADDGDGDTDQSPPGDSS
jgi:plastocyanin